MGIEVAEEIEVRRAAPFTLRTVSSVSPVSGPRRVRYRPARPPDTLRTSSTRDMRRLLNASSYPQGCNCVDPTPTTNNAIACSAIPAVQPNREISVALTSQ